jgi:hypothetical protein
MKISIGELKRIIVEATNAELQRKKLIELFKSSLKDRNNSHALFGLMRTVGVPDERIQRLRISFKGTDINSIVALFKSILDKYVI